MAEQPPPSLQHTLLDVHRRSWPPNLPFPVAELPQPEPEPEPEPEQPQEKPVLQPAPEPEAAVPSAPKDAWSLPACVSVDSYATEPAAGMDTTQHSVTSSSSSDGGI